MANGYCTPILQHIEALSGVNPAKKLAPLGFTQMLLQGLDDSVKVINDGFQQGHKRDVFVKYRERVLESAIGTTPNACDTAVTPAYKEWQVPSLDYREYSFFVPDSLIRQYCKDSSDNVKLDNSTGTMMLERETTVMREVYEMFVEGGQALLKSMNTALVTSMATQFGINTTTGSNAAKQIDFDMANAAMHNALIDLISDWRENEFCDDVFLVGNGPLANMELVRSIFANSAEGIDKARLSGLIPKVYFDKDTRAIWGTDHIGVFERGSIALLTRNLYAGTFARHLANSHFFAMPLPTNEYHCPQDGLDKLIFDVQIREIDCPTSMTINGQSAQTVEKGVQIIMSKYFKLFVKPDMYNALDPLSGTNGTLRYKLTKPDPCYDPCTGGEGEG